MRRITFWLLSTITVVVLLFSYRTSTDATLRASSPTANDAATTSDNTDTTPTSESGSTPSSSATDSAESSGDSAEEDSTEATAGTASYTGAAASTRYGDVQVKITVTDGKITKSEVTQVPWNNGHDQRINGAAVPILNQETLDAQSADIDMVSGATFTSQGYIESLQSAIDQAHLS